MTEAIPPSGQQPIQPQPSPANQQDPLKVWQKFLSQGGNIATEEQTKQFVDGVLKFFNTLLAKERAKVSKANKRLKDVIEGKE